MNCTFCGAINKPNAKFCASCGRVVIDASIAPFNPKNIVVFVSSSQKQVGPLSAEQFLDKYSAGEITDIDFLLGKDKKWKQWSQAKAGVIAAMPALAEIKPVIARAPETTLPPTQPPTYSKSQTPTPAPSATPPITPSVRPDIPGENSSLVVGIISLILAFIIPPIAVILGIVGIILAASAKGKASQYSVPRENVARTGKILSIIAICVGSFFCLCWGIYFAAIYGEMPGYYNSVR